MDVVDETLREWRRTAFEYGRHDCCLALAHYAARCGHRDVTARFEGRYTDHDGALAIMREYGGIPGLIALIGHDEREGAPQRGDIVELEYESGDTIAGLCTGGFVAVLLERGIAEVALRLVRVRGVWRVGR